MSNKVAETLRATQQQLLSNIDGNTQKVPFEMCLGQRPQLAKSLHDRHFKWHKAKMGCWVSITGWEELHEEQSIKERGEIWGK